MNAPLQDIDCNAADVQPLHQDKKPLSNLDYQRQLLAKKIAEQDPKFASPTDSMMSPCTAKLQANKNRHCSKYVTFSLPMSKHELTISGRSRSSCKVDSHK